jgi:transcription elongation factor Elf1
VNQIRHKVKPRNKKAIRQWLRRYKKNKTCFICGEDHPACLEFHHEDPNFKNGTISNMISRYSDEEIKEEILKCKVVCSNCHRKINWSNDHEDDD